MPASAARNRSAVLHRTLNRTPTTVVSGDGAYLIDAAGKRYLDASGGAAVSCLGHSHPRVIAAVQRQIAELPFAHGSFFTSEPAERLARRLADAAPAGFAEGRVAFVGSGSEAMEAALKLTRQHFVEKGEPQRRHIISRRMSYHGATLGALAVGGHPGRRALYQPLLIETTQIAPCHPYRFREPDESLEVYGRRVADELDQAIETLGPETVGCFIAEPIVGATLGSVPAVPGYFRRIREICDRHGVLFIADEVMCGMGRAGSLFTIEQEGVSPDMIIVAKGLGAGYQPIGALLARDSVLAPIEAGSGVLAHGQTYMAHSVGCAAALAVQEAVEDEDLLANVGRMGEVLSRALADSFGDHPHVGDIRGRGLFWSLELVQDRATKAPFPAALGLAARIKAEAQDLGLICYPSAGTADGVDGDHVLLAPPFIVGPEQVAEIIEKLQATFDRVLPEAA